MSDFLYRRFMFMIEDARCSALIGDWSSLRRAARALDGLSQHFGLHSVAPLARQLYGLSDQGRKYSAYLWLYLLEEKFLEAIGLPDQRAPFDLELEEWLACAEGKSSVDWRSVAPRIKGQERAPAPLFAVP